MKITYVGSVGVRSRRFILASSDLRDVHRRNERALLEAYIRRRYPGAVGDVQLPPPILTPYPGEHPPHITPSVLLDFDDYELSTLVEEAVAADVRDLKPIGSHSPPGRRAEPGEIVDAYAAVGLDLAGLAEGRVAVPFEAQDVVRFLVGRFQFQILDEVSEFHRRHWCDDALWADDFDVEAYLLDASASGRRGPSAEASPRAGGDPVTGRAVPEPSGADIARPASSPPDPGGSKTAESPRADYPSVPPSEWYAGPDLIRLTRQISRSFTLRGRARHDRGEIAEAIEDYAQALLHGPPGLRDYEYDPEAYSWRLEALDALRRFFRAGAADAPSQEPDGPAAPPLRIRWGHLLTGDDNILAVYPLGPEGRRVAVDQADRLARDAGLRREFDEGYMTQSDRFDVVVYEYDGTRPVEVYRARPRSEE